MSGKDKNTTRSPKQLMIILSCLVAVALVASVSLITMTIIWRKQREKLRDPTEQYVCRPLNQLVILTDDESDMKCPKGLLKKYDPESDTSNITCCGIHTDVMLATLKKALSEKYDGDSSPEFYKLNLTEYNCEVDTKPQPMAMLLDLERKTVKVGTTTKLFWKNESPSYTNPGLKYLPHDGTIYVEEPGLYYIFTQLVSKVEPEEVRHGDSNSVYSHLVYLISEGVGSVILEDSLSACEVDNDNTETTSVMGAVFNLKAGDRIYMATSHPHKIKPDTKSNFLSIHTL